LFTLPGLLSETLGKVGAAGFLAAIIKENLKLKLDIAPRITVFAPLSKPGSDHTVEGQVIYNFLGYTPDLVPGQNYGGITITKERGQLFANGARIVKGNVPIKNGVVHFVDKVSPPFFLYSMLDGGVVNNAKLVKSTPPRLTPNATSALPSATRTPPPVVTGAAAILNGAPNMVFGVLAFGLGLWIAI